MWLTLAAAGDVSGIDPRQVVRMEPSPDTSDYEANDLAAVEFDDPELPWLFTPAGAGNQGRLRPWLVLVVVEERDGVQLRRAIDEALPVLQIAPPARPGDELPDLAESWAWAHAQVAAPTTTTAETEAQRAEALRTLLAGAPERCVSRLIAPRLLRPFTRYLACMVPAFEAGRLAGLNLPLAGASATQLLPAWASGPQAPDQVTLPVYHHWRFATGARDDFEAMVRRLVARDLSGKVGRRPMEIAQPGFSFPGSRPDALEVEGALQPRGAARAIWPGAGQHDWREALRGILNAAARPAAGTGDPLVGPPIYGRWQAQRDRLDPASTVTWLDDLNLDPRERVAAALGTCVVQQAQEALVAQAWDQAGELDRANQYLRQLQLSEVVCSRLYERNVRTLGAAASALWRLTAPVHARLAWQSPVGAPPQSLRMFLATRSLPRALLAAPMRRLMRPGGEIARRAESIKRRASVGTARPEVPSVHRSFTSSVIDVFSKTLQIDNILPPPPSIGMVSFDAVTRTLTARPPRLYVLANSRAVADAPQQPRFRVTPRPTEWIAPAPPASAVRPRREPIEPIDPPPGNPRPPAEPSPPDPPEPPAVDSEDAKAFRVAAQRHLEKVNPAGSVVGVVRPPLDVGGASKALVQLLDPAPALLRRSAATVRLSDGRTMPSRPHPVGFAPRFELPMSEPLAALSQDWLLPGLENVPADTVALLETNRRFIEAYMAGVNVEMARELLWRDYPLDSARATFFHRFWRGASDDIKPMATWGTRRLGEVGGAETAPRAVLLVRSALFRRYPGAVVYAVRARRVGAQRAPDEQAVHRQPLFRGALPPDVLVLRLRLEL